MKIVQIDIKNIRSIAAMTMRPKALNVITGDNGMGKTSILKAIAAVVNGGHDPTIRRNLDYGKTLPDGTPMPPRYASKGEVSWKLDTGVTIDWVVTEKRYTLDIKNPDGTPVEKSPREFMESLAGGFSFDPLEFCAAKPKERLAYIQRALGINFSPDEVAEACEMKPPAPVDIEGLDRIRKVVYESRTKVNTLRKQSQSTVDRLLSVLSDEETENWTVEAERLQKERDAAIATLAARNFQVVAEANEERKKAAEEFENKVAELRKALQVTMGAVDKAEREAQALVESEERGTIDSLTVKHATAQEKARNAAQREVIKGEIKTATDEAAKHAAASEALTTKLDAIDALKKRKLQTLEDSIPGMQPVNGDLWVNGVPFDDLNTGEQFMRAFQVAALAPGDLGMMIADRAESLSPESFELFQDAALNSGFQVFTTRVTDGDLAVNCLESAA